MAQPDHLAVYLSNSCNLACSYCYVSVNQGPAAAPSFEQLQRSVDFFLSEVDHPEKKITFLGGEPFLNWPLFSRIARYARQAGGRDLILQTFTNGTLLSPERLALLNELDVHCTISLDGRKESNDRERVYFKTKDRSVFEDVMARLEGLPKDRLGVSLVFTSETISDFLSNVDFFYKLGFGRITFNPELYEAWPEERLQVMRAQLAGLARYYKLLLDGGARPFQIPILYSVLANDRSNAEGLRWWHDCHNVVYGPDDKFYACDKALTFPVGEVPEQRVGSPSEGMDWAGRRAHFDRAIASIEADGSGGDEIFCPMGVYFYGEHKGVDTKPLIANFRRVAAVFSEGLLALADELKDHPTFQELYVHAHVV